jgi:hypothetical protein
MYCGRSNFAGVQMRVLPEQVIQFYIEPPFMKQIVALRGAILKNKKELAPLTLDLN